MYKIHDSVEDLLLDPIIILKKNIYQSDSEFSEIGWHRLYTV